MPKDFLNESITAYKSYKDNPAATAKIFENYKFTNAQDFIKDFPHMTENTNKTPLYKSPAFLKGLLLGAGIAYVATNKTVQQAVISASVRLFTSVQGSFEEMKEQIQDIKAELSNEE